MTRGVLAEVTEGRANAPDTAQIMAAIDAGWIEVRDGGLAEIQHPALGRGEIETIALAGETSAVA